MYKGVIFDLDGTLLNTLSDLAYAGNYTLKKMGLPVHDIDKYRYFVGNGIPKLVERFLPCEATADMREEALKTFCSYYSKHMNDNTKPYDSVLEMLRMLKKKQIKTAVVTNKAHNFAVEIVDEYFGDLIDNVYGSVEGFPKKPDPYWTEKAAAEFGFDKEEILYIGDSGVDMLTAANSGLTSVGVLWGFRGEDELLGNGAVHICRNCSEILNLVLDSSLM